MSRDRHCEAGDVAFRVLVLLILAVAPLKAYADPGSGLLLWQVAAAFFLGSVYQIRKLFVRFRKRK